jgi:predicted nucleic acid-binding protein
VRFVADASLLARALIESQLMDEALALVSGAENLFGPRVVEQEVVNAIHIAERRGRIGRESADEALSELRRLDDVYRF